jgi:competence protein ComEC
MDAWSRYPFIRLLIPLISGILICYYSNHFLNIQWWIPAFGISLLIIRQLLPKNYINYSNRWVFGALLNITIILLGYFLTSTTFKENQKTHFSNIDATPDYYIGQLIDQPVNKKQTCKAVLNIIGVKHSGKLFKTNGKIIAFIKKDSLSSVPVYGDNIVFYKDPVQLENPGNPYEFNYKSYLANRQINYIVYLNTNDYRIVSSNNGNFLKSLALSIREYLVSKLAASSLRDKELSVAIALVTGYNDLLDKEQRQEYAGAGVIHILCVSGLHVGIIFILAEFAFSFLRNIGRFRFMQPVFIILTIWLYALITGFAPPVLRAAMMFTLIVIGKYTHRQSTSLNSLAIAAFILLIIDPRVLFDVGFQLSFTAVLGILLFQSPISSVFSPVNPIIKYIWDIFSISLSAQVFTGPLVVYYFHQFPVYFLLSNLIAIPLSGIIIYIGILLLSTSFIPILFKLISTVMAMLIKALNYSVGYIENIPGSIVQGISINEFDVLLVIIAIVCIIYFFIYRTKSLLWISLSCMICLSASYSFIKYERDRQQMIVFHKISKHPMISFIEGREHIIITDSILGGNIKMADYQLLGLKEVKGLKIPAIKKLSIPTNVSQYYYKRVYNSKSVPEFYSFKDKRLVVISGDCLLAVKGSFFETDYVLLCNNPIISLQQIKLCFPNAMIIADNTVSKRNCAEFSKEAEKLGMHLYNIQNEGALVIDL